MDIYRVDDKLGTNEKVKKLNEMIRELEGAFEQGKFNLNELNQLITDLGIDRKFLRNQSLGHLVSNYTDWSHLKAETGYSIWKITPTNYKYNANNKLYFDDTLLENRGEAGSESATTFDNVFHYDAESGEGIYNDHTTEAGTEGGTEFALMDTTTDYLYLGEASTFAGVKFEFQKAGINYTLKVEYYDGTSGVGWTELTANLHNLDDDTSNFASDGKITWTIPSTWETTTINGASKYWIRISTTTTPTTIAKAYYIIPGDCVPALLALSSTQILNEDWAWCTYGSSIYVTIRNTGDGDYEGNYFITSASSVTNLKNFFIYNHEYKADYEDSTYVAETYRMIDISDNVVTVTTDCGLTTTDKAIIVDASSENVTITLPSAVGLKGKKFIVKAKALVSGVTHIRVEPPSGELIDDVWGFYDLVNDYSWVHFLSDGQTWYIIGEKV